MKTKFLQIAVTVYVGAALLMFLTACNGGSSDPLKNYDIKGGPVTNIPSEKQDEVGVRHFTVQIIGSKSFVEGVESKVTIKVSPRSQQIKNFSLNFINFPHSETPQIQPTGTTGEFDLIWKAPVGVIPPGKSDLDLENPIPTLLVTTTETNDHRLRSTADLIPLDLRIVKNSITPKIVWYTPIDKDPKGIEEGTKVPFIIDVDDPASIANGFPPEIKPSQFIFSNPEAFCADGMSLVQPDRSRGSYFENKGNGKWRFYYVIDASKPFTDNLDRKGNIDPNASSLNICFYLNVENVNKATDPQNKMIQFVGRFAAQAPVLNWNEQNSIEIKSGVESYFKFTIQSVNGMGKVEIKDQPRLLAGLSGTKSLKCEPTSAQNSNQKECTLVWTPTCTRTNSNKKLSIKTENRINNKVKESLFEKDLVILANEELCPAKKPATKTTQTNKGVAR